MIHLHVIDLCEREGFSSIYKAACAATRGDLKTLSKLGLLGYTTETAHDLCKMIERAWFCESQILTASTIKRARG
jgi:hypothetical protein